MLLERIMPNWCANTLKLTPKTEEAKALMPQITERFSNGGAFNYIHPMPAELEDTTSPSDAPNWYDWRVSNWGTKWSEAEAHIVSASDDHLLVSFDTAWSPPFGVYERLVELGFAVTATYAECGMGFAGIYRDGVDTGLTMEYIEDVELDEILRKTFAGHDLSDELLPPHTGG